MEQMSYCLTQAYEFSQSARASGLSTRALQAYYSLTSLANAEILWRGDGMASIDARERKYNKHGFRLKIGNTVEDFVAVPQVGEDEKVVGLFGLWKDHSRHIPHYGLERTHYPSGTNNSGYIVLSSITPLSEFIYPKGGLNIIDCFRHLPSLHGRIENKDVTSNLLKGTMSSEIVIDENNAISSKNNTTIIHPCEDKKLGPVLEKFRYSPATVPQVEIIEMPRGAIIRVNQSSFEKQVDTAVYDYFSPESFSFRKDEVYFVGDGDFLNEFGYTYVGLYIMGMISRYHPQTWIKEIKNSSEITLLVDEFIDSALVRAPLLTLGQIEDTAFVYDQ
jgi:hypothetical protein